MARIVLFVHGWSVRHTDTYGELPERLASEARSDSMLALDVRHLYLGRYVSFHDEVRIADLSRAFEEAVGRELGTLLAAGQRFVAITHSTGGPLMRDWWDRYYVQRGRAARCPMSHLIMLAPANFGSALAQLGKGRVGRLKSWFEGVEPGTGVLDWLEHGSPEAWELNRNWFEYDSAIGREDRVFPFVLPGQSIDRSFYDQLNSYTGEIGSDGVVRAAAANLNTTYVRLMQEVPQAAAAGNSPDYAMSYLRRTHTVRSPEVPFALIPGRSHSGEEKGILRSVRDDGRPDATVAAILQCLRVNDAPGFAAVKAAFTAQTARVDAQERLERVRGFFPVERAYCHDPHTLVIVRVLDDAGERVPEFDLVLTAGADDDPNHLPQGFLRDRQRDKRHPATLSFFFNYAAMHGAPAVTGADGKTYRAALPGSESLGFQVHPVAQGPFVHHVPARLKASLDRLELMLRPHETTMVDVVLRRIVRRGAFELGIDRTRASFKDQAPGTAVETGVDG